MKRLIRFPGGKTKALTLSYDDGVEQDKKLIDILNQHELKCTFNLNSGLYSPEDAIFDSGQLHRILSKSAATALYSDSGHEVAVHSLTHPFLEKLSPSKAIYEIIEDKKNLEQQFGTVVRGMAYPYGTFNEQTIKILKKVGIAYARTVISTEDFRLPTDWYKLTATCHHNCSNLMDIANKFVKNNPIKEDAWLFYVWGHSYEFEGENNWELIEKFAKYVSSRSDVWYATNIQIYRYLQAYNRLQFSVCGKYVYNPSAINVYFENNNQIHEVKPGNVLHISFF